MDRAGRTSSFTPRGLSRSGRHDTPRSLNLIGDLLNWLTLIGAMPTNLNERRVEQYLRRRSRKQSIQPGDRAALRCFLSVLREAGAIALAASPPLTPHDQIFDAFSHYLREERGLAQNSVVHHLPFIRLFLHEVCSGGASDLCRISQADAHATSSAMPAIRARPRQVDVLDAALIPPISPS